MWERFVKTETKVEIISPAKENTIDVDTYLNAGGSSAIKED
jgi:hypothetical protein